MRQLRQGAKPRSVVEISAGDFIQLTNREWKRVAHNTAEGAYVRAPRDWTIRTQDGDIYTMYDIAQYAKAQDMEPSTVALRAAFAGWARQNTVFRRGGPQVEDGCWVKSEDEVVAELLGLVDGIVD